MSSIFTKIVNREIPAYIVAESASCLAFLDIAPLAKGHCLVIPKKEVDYIFDLTDAELQDLMVFAKQVARSIESVVPCKRMGMSVIGLEVPHAHIHLIPLNSIKDINFSSEKLSLQKEELEHLTLAIASAFKS